MSTLTKFLRLQVHPFHFLSAQKFINFHKNLCNYDHTIPKLGG